MIDPATMPDCLEVTAETIDGIVMGVRHRALPIEGVQFHPESILTAAGHDLLATSWRGPSDHGHLTPAGGPPAPAPGPPRPPARAAR